MCNRLLHRSLYIFCLTLIVFHCAAGQIRQHRFGGLSQEDGLASFRVYDVCQDVQGFLWIGTLNGLDRYDGYGFRHFTRVDIDSMSLSHNQARTLLVDRNGALWVGTDDGGLNRFDRTTERFTRFAHDPRDSLSISEGAIRALYEDKSGTIWVGTLGGGLNRLVLVADTTSGTKDGSGRREDRAGNSRGRTRATFVHYRHDPGNQKSLSDNRVYSILEDHGGLLWIGTENGLNMLDKSTGTCTRYFHEETNPNSLSANFVRSVFQDGSGTLWVGTDGGGLNRFDWNIGRVTHYLFDASNPKSIIGNDVTSVLERSPGLLLVGTLEGLCQLKKESGEFDCFRPDPTNPFALRRSVVRQIRRDRSGVIWIATDNGLAKILPRTEQFIHYRHGSDNTKSDYVFSILETPARINRGGGKENGRLGSALWIAPENEGLKRIELETGSVTTFKHDPHDPGSLPSNYVRSVFTDSRGTLWVGTYGAGLARYDPLTDRFFHYVWGPGARNFVVYAFCEDHQRNIWLGTLGDGLLKFDPRTHQFVHYRHEPAHPASLSNNNVFAVHEDADGILWIGTEGGGLNRYDPKKNEFVQFKHSSFNRGSISNDRVYALKEDRRGRFWVSTAGGLNLFDRKSGVFTTILGRDSVSIPICSAIIEDTKGNLWMSTLQEGIFRFDPEKNEFRNFDVWDGLQSNRFTEAACIRTTGEIIFGGRNGFNVFHPDSIRNNQRVPSIVLTSFKLFDKPAKFDTSVSEITVIPLNYDQNYFSFEFAALDFTVPEKNQYAYKLEGLDNEWVYPKGRRFAGYTNIDPGNYVFRVKGSNNDGVWNQEGASIRITISPPYWATWWFRALIGSMVISLVAVAYNYRVSKLLEMERMRVRIASDLHDDIGSSLSGIALVTDAMRRRLALEEGEVKQLSDVSHAARHTADALRDIVWLVKPENDKLGDIVLRMKDSAAKLLVGIEYSFQCDENKMSSVLDMEVRRHLLLIYKETLNNIAKHSKATKVEIRIGQSNGAICLEVKDNGIGFDESAIQHGNGLLNLRRRAEEIGGTVQISSSPGCGTTVQLTATVS